MNKISPFQQRFSAINLSNKLSHFTFRAVIFFGVQWCIIAPVWAQWNPNAGVIPSFTWDAFVTVSSGYNGSEVVDHDEKTKWQSGAPLPNGFLKNSSQNILFQTEAGQFKSSGSVHSVAITDGDLKSSTQVSGNRESWVEISFPNATSIRSLSLKCSLSSLLYVFAFQADNDSSIITTLSEADGYKWRRFDTKFNSVKKLKLTSSKPFQVFELAAISLPLTEQVILDLGSAKTIGWLETRHWAGGKASATEALVSLDNRTWFHIAHLDPKAVNTVTTYLEKPVTARFLRIQHTLIEEDYAKVYVWEINAWDSFGPYGKMPPAKKSNSTVAEIMGVNGLWGWGYGICSAQLDAGKGPQKFSKVSSHARSYHNWYWDVTDPDNIPDYSQMADSGTQSLKWLDWDKEYRAWKNAGLQVDASIQFEQKKLPQNLWDNPQRAAYNYGYAFAKHFGSSGNGLVQIMEAGNEPWDYPAGFYTQVLKGFATGAKAADSKMIVLPCALQAAFPYEETEKKGNFSGARITQDVAPFIDGLNVHHYSYARDAQGKRIAVHPEHVQSTVRAIFNDIRFRDANLPGKKIYVTEWGWDSDGAGESCKHGECVTENEQALYAVRGALFFIRLGVEKLNWFNFMNGNGGLYSRSGLTGSPATDFAEKKSFRVFEALLLHLADKYFLGVIQENDEAWVYQFGDADGKATHLVAWKPVDGEEKITSVVKIPGYIAETAWKISGDSKNGELAMDLVSNNMDAKEMSVTASAIPIIVQLAK